MISVVIINLALIMLILGISFFMQKSTFKKGVLTILGMAGILVGFILILPAVATEEQSIITIAHITTSLVLCLTGIVAFFNK